MNGTLRTHTESLRAVLLELPATGARGFEGLIATALAEVCGVPFRLAGSGAQFGVDARATYADDAICLEGKRYATRINKNEVISKIAEAAISDGDIDLWVLGASVQISAQLAGSVKKLGEQHGIGTLILDWTTNDLPPLAVVLAMAETAVPEFLSHHVKDAAARAKAVKALAAVRKSKSFLTHATRIRRQLEAPGIGTGLAREANSAWLHAVFTSKRQARNELGQPLAPGDDTEGHKATPRDDLARKLAAQLTGEPNGSIVAVLGEEGNGKSWLAAQSWLDLPEKPLSLIFTADDFAESTHTASLEDLLIERLIRQTGKTPSEAATRRWQRRLQRWQDAANPPSPRLIVFIDGLNQRPQTDWARLIEGLGATLEKIGARLVVTARSAFFETRIRGRLVSTVTCIKVPEWTDTERDGILAAHGIDGGNLNADVAASLRNPRLLGIALALLQQAEIKQLEELTVSRLLFEHMRAHERDGTSVRPAQEFARTLQAHAEEIVQRHAAAQQDDVTVFDQEQLKAVSDGRFFVELEGDPTRYRIEKNGLTLALGFAVVDKLRAGLRNNHDLTATLETLIEPIGALDDTASVLIAALTIACIDETSDAEIIVAIVSAFADTQNPDAQAFDAFSGFCERRVEAFMKTAHRMCLGGKSRANFDWIQGALYNAAETTAWTTMLGELQKWLRYYTLSVAHSMLSHVKSDGEAKVEEERANKQAKIDGALSALSAAEQNVLASLVRQEDGDLNALSRLAFRLMAGKPLAPFAASLAQWCFANALNASAWAPHKELAHLVRLNRIDWADTRRAILDACRPFEGKTVSPTGQWALANLLRATGHADDAARAAELTARLTAHLDLPGGWRRVEQYCATDPCDPASKKPANIGATAQRYAAIDVSAIRLGMGNTSEDHDFEMMRPGMARFERWAAVRKHRHFIADVLGREGFPLRQGVLELHNNNALLTRKDALALVSMVGKTGAAADEALGEQDRWIVSQYRQLLAFPLMSADEQVQTLLSDDPEGRMLIALGAVAKPLDTRAFAARLEKACREQDENAQFRLLAHHTGTKVAISVKARRRLAELLHSASKHVRMQALALVARCNDRKLISIVADSAWSAETTEKDDRFEAWYGSLVVIEAARRGLVSPEDALNRISQSLHGRAARILGTDAARRVAQRIDASIRRAAGLTNELAIADFELPVLADDDLEPSRYRASEKEDPLADPLAAFKRFAESADEYDERQRRLWEAFESFKATLIRGKAGLILDRLDTADFDAIAAADEALAARWYELFMSLRPERLPGVHNLCLLLAHALAVCEPDKAAALFRHVQRSQPFVRLTFGYAGIPLDAMTVWSAADGDALNDLRFERLDAAGNDHELALEVMAALWNKKEHVLKRYMEKRIAMEEPAATARAIMVAGFSDRNTASDRILAHYRGTAGLIGQAQQAAAYAYERNAWAAHWFEKMYKSERAVDFWWSSVLFAKVVDGRFHTWHAHRTAPGEPFRLFWPSVESMLHNRFKKRRSDREKKLFGGDAPERVFLGLLGK